MSYIRTVVGLISRFSSSSTLGAGVFVAANWTGGTGMTATVVSNKLRVAYSATNPNQNRVLRLDASPSQAKRLIHTVSNGSQGFLCGPAAHVNDITSTSADCVEYGVYSAASGTVGPFLQEIVAGAAAVSVDQGIGTGTGDETACLFVNGTALVGYHDDAGVTGGNPATATAGTHSTGQAGICGQSGGAETADFAMWIESQDRYLTITGLPGTAVTAELQTSASVLVQSQSVSGGAVTFDMMLMSGYEAIALSKLVVKDSGGTPIAALANDLTNDIYVGGDTYVWTNTLSETTEGAEASDEHSAETFVAPTADVIAGILIEPLLAQVSIVLAGTGATSRRLERRAGGSSDPWVTYQTDATATVIDFYDDTLEPALHYEWRLVAVNAGGEVASNVVDLNTPDIARPNTPTLTIVEEAGVDLIGDDEVTVESSAYSHPDGDLMYDAEYRVLDSDGDVVGTVLGILFDPDDPDAWRIATLGGLSGDPLFVQVRHRAVPFGDGDDTVPVPSLWSAAVEFSLEDFDPDPDPEDPFDRQDPTPVNYRSEYPYGTWREEWGYPPLPPTATCFGALTKLWVTVSHNLTNRSTNIGGRTAFNADFERAGRKHGYPGVWKFHCPTGPLRSINTGVAHNKTLFSHTPFAPDTPFIDLPIVANIAANAVFTGTSITFSWGEDPDMMVVGSSGYAFPFSVYEDAVEAGPIEGTADLHVIPDFGGVYRVEILKNGLWVTKETIPFGPRYFSRNPVTGEERWVERRNMMYDDFQIEGWEVEIDISDITDVLDALAGVRAVGSQIRLTLDGRAPRTTAPFWIDRGSDVIHKSGTGLRVADLTFGGSSGESGRWSNTADGVRRRGEADTQGYAALEEMGNLRGFELIATGAWATRRQALVSESTGLNFLIDRDTHWGVGGYFRDVGDEFSAIAGRLAGSFVATGYNRIYNQAEGAYAFSWWYTGSRHAKGGAYRQITRSGPRGDPLSVGIASLSAMDQWNRSPVGRGPSVALPIEAVYTHRLRVDLLQTFLDGTHQVRVIHQVHGPGIDATETELLTGDEWDCGMCGLLGRSLVDGGITEFYSLAVLPLAECEVEGEVAGPCMLEWTLYEADGVTIRAQASTHPTWLGASGEAMPYLLDPLQYGSPYGEQEVDFVKGTASIGQVNIRLIDRPTIAGDQDSGWFTALKNEVAGNRNRVRRFIDEDNGWVTVADGPGGFPKLLGSFAGYEVPIRDTREKERRLRAFAGTSPVVILPFGLLEGQWGGYGEYGAALVEEAGFISAIFIDDPEAYATGGYFQIFEKPEGVAFYPPYNAAMGRATEITMFPGGGSGYYPNVAVIWRLKGEGDGDWKYAGEQPGSSTEESQRRVHAPGAGWPMLDVQGDPDRYVGHIWVTFETGEMPGPGGTEIEFYVLYVGPANEAFPFYIDDLTAGEFLRNLYDGEYSPRDPVTGGLVPTGIRYDEGALLEMTTPVRMRITEAVKDIRAWTEANIYAPLGYAPALDADGQISPVSQVIPTDGYELSSLTEIGNAITQAVPGHAPGDNVINILTLKYQRAYSDPDNSTAIDGLVMRDVEYIYRDETSIQRHGEQGDPNVETVVLVAIGDENGNALGDEEGALAAAARRDNLFERRVNGTDLVVVPVMRLATFHLRVGDFVHVTLSWLPNDNTGRRALNHLAQILAIKDLNCSWREMTHELVAAWEPVTSP